jgi:RNA polymerase sigma-B factor
MAIAESETIPERPAGRSIEGFFELQRSGDPALRNQLVQEHRWIAVHCARRFANRGEAMDDLVQVAMLGLVLAVDRFAPDLGVQFSTFAVPTILGELRRHFRDRTWPLRVTRRVKELHLAVSAISEQLSHELGRPPKVEDVADALDISVDEVLEAMEAGACYRTASLDAPSRAGDDEPSPIDGGRLAVVDEDLVRADVRVTVRDAVAELPERERKVVYLRFYEGLSQSEIASRIGVSQVHVSRILRAVLTRLEHELDGAEGIAELVAASA